MASKKNEVSIRLPTIAQSKRKCENKTGYSWRFQDLGAVQQAEARENGSLGSSESRAVLPRRVPSGSALYKAPRVSAASHTVNPHHQHHVRLTPNSDSTPSAPEFWADPPVWMSNLNLFVAYNYESLLHTFSNPVRTSLNNYFVISENGFLSFIGRSSFQCSFSSKATIQRK